MQAGGLPPTTPPPSHVERTGTARRPARAAGGPGGVLSHSRGQWSVPAPHPAARLRAGGWGRAGAGLICLVGAPAWAVGAPLWGVRRRSAGRLAELGWVGTSRPCAHRRSCPSSMYGRCVVEATSGPSHSSPKASQGPPSTKPVRAPAAGEPRACGRSSACLCKSRTARPRPALLRAAVAKLDTQVITGGLHCRWRPTTDNITASPC